MSADVRGGWANQTAVKFEMTMDGQPFLYTFLCFFRGRWHMGEVLEILDGPNPTEGIVVPEFPPELYDDILSRCSLSTLVSVSLLSKAFQEVANRHLYHTVDLQLGIKTSNHKPVYACLEGLSKAPSAAIHVRSLVLSVLADCRLLEQWEAHQGEVRGAMMAVCEALPNLRSLEFLSVRTSAWWVREDVEGKGMFEDVLRLVFLFLRLMLVEG